VDDNIIIKNILNTTLASAGYSVSLGSNGEESIKLAKENSPHIIMLDIMMTGIDGGDVANFLRNNEKTKNIPIIFLSLYRCADMITAD
jgi:CheY-like chemotaxis protein